MKGIISVSCFVALTAFCSSAFASDFIMIQNAWIRSVPSNVKAMAAYMTITNTSNETRKLTAVSCKLFSKVEIHRTVMHEGITKMVLQKELIIPAGKSVSLEPGGYHLMLIDLEAVPREGDEVEMELQFDDGQTLRIKIPVRFKSPEVNTIDMHHH